MLVVVHWDLNIVVQIKLDILLLDILWIQVVDYSDLPESPGALLVNQPEAIYV